MLLAVDGAQRIEKQRAGRVQRRTAAPVEGSSRPCYALQAVVDPPRSVPPPSAPTGGAPSSPPTVAAAVRALQPGLSWRQAEALCRAGRVLVDGEPATDGARRLAEGAALSLLPAAPRTQPLLAADEAIAYLDRDLVVARKPPGLLTVPWEEDDGSPSLAVALRELLQKLDRPRGLRHLPSLGVVSRLDKASSGLVIFARNEPTRQALERLFAAHDLEREYLALAQGRPPEGLHRSYLADDRGDGRRGSVRRGAQEEGGAQRGRRPGKVREALTEVRVLETRGPVSLLACRLQTGRKHQIRIHLAEAGCPILGETVYVRDHPAPRLAAPRLMLHAWRLALRHPASGRMLRLEDPMPADMAGLWEGMKNGPGQDGRIG